jgi:hypothetical protein
MNLRDFVKNSLTDVLNGIKDAQRDPDIGSHVVQGAVGSLKFPANSGVVRESGFSATTVQFDVAVVVEREDTGGAGAKVNIGVVSG